MMWGSSKQSQLRRDCSLWAHVATALDEYIIAKSLVEPIVYVIRRSWRLTRNLEVIDSCGLRFHFQRR
jgi:hypothetical protein